MDQLSATWNQKLERETRDCETRERVERERAVLLPPPQTPTSTAYNGTPETVVSQPDAAKNHSSVGRKQQRPSNFTILAASLWKQKQGPNGRVSINDLKAIADIFDSQKFTPPADYLEKKGAKELKARNSRNANSKSAGAIRTWSALVTRGDKDDLRAMRRVLVRCASKQS
jgi:hypothetical protein